MNPSVPVPPALGILVHLFERESVGGTWVQESGESLKRQLT